MKTFRKLLALLVVLALAAGTLAMPASAMRRDLSFWPDANDFDWNYRQAAEVLVYLEILEGDEGGMRPLDTITRAEACKIITFICLGPSAGAHEGETAHTNYVDVPDDEWYSWYVAYCTRAGIVSGDNGDGTGTFRPNDKITGYEFGKLCLCAIGYDSRLEGFENDDWQENIADLAGTVGTSSNMLEEFQWGNYITRQEAFQMAIDAMKKDVMVKVLDDNGAAVGYEGETLENILWTKYSTVYVFGVIEQNVTATGDYLTLGGFQIPPMDEDRIGMVASAYFCYEDTGEIYCITLRIWGW